MSKKVVRKVKEEKAPVKVGVSLSLTELYYDIDTVKMGMRNYTDSELFDFCMDHIQMYEHKELDRLYPKLAAGGKLEKTEREALEAFCILANTELCLSV